MTRTPLVDVAIVTYNHENFVAQAIESVLSQEFDGECRLIIGDDYSTDRTQAIVADYAQRYPDRIITIFSSEHLGLAHKDRVGLKVLESCTAKYVAMLDGDDYWTDVHKLQKQVGFLESHPDFAISCHNVTLFYEDGSKEAVNLLPPDQREVSTLEDLLLANFIPTCSVVFRRGLFGKLPDWYFSLSIGDWPIHIMNAQHGKIGYINEAMAAYRVHHAGVWSSWGPVTQQLEIIRMLDYVDAYLEFSYEKTVKKAKAAWYYRLAETSHNQGDRVNARIFLKKYFSFSDLEIRKEVLSLLLRIETPALYKRLITLRDFVRSAASNKHYEHLY